MRMTALALALLLCATAAWAHTTKDFLFRCAQDETACAAKIKEVLRRIENPPPGRAVLKLCLPAGLSDEGLVGEVTYWIDEQGSRYDNQDEDDSIAAALKALYPCGGIKGIEDDDL